ncbi:hypothetical protein LCGC14_1585690 [marine sediment metagenome]|uniref:Uncharacterized protein n=1 Tax=marine sediment metagenome TaxID=412755 RepID=A0A0F9IFF5_9ZZZZ
MDIIDTIIKKQLYEGIRDQDGWETLNLTIRSEYPWMAELIIERLKTI